MEFTPVKILIGSLWLITGFFEYADYCYIWQLKEYRRDRFKDFLSTEQGRRYFLRPLFFVHFLAFLIAIFYPVNNEWQLKYLLLTVLLFDLSNHIIKFFRHKLRRPKFTSKAIMIIFLSLLIGTGVLLLLKDWTLAFLILLSRFIILTAVVALTEIPTRISKKIIIWWATKKMKKFPHLKIIGITGSYGKSSVKEFTAHILSQKFKVIKTPQNINSEIGVAKFILKTDFSQAEFFIVEMGAYKMGEIKLICDMVHPQVGILTAIAEQHLSLFGSIKNIQHAKYELLRSIPQNGFVVTNSDNKYCMELLPELTCQHIETFGADPEKHPSCLTTNYKTSRHGTEFEGSYGGFSGTVMTPVIGAHQGSNIAPAVIVGYHFGLNHLEIKHGCETLPTNTQGSLKIYDYGKATIVDDSYNSNPQGFKSAIDVLTLFPSEKRRVVITRGMLELGERSEELHELMGGEIAFVADELVIITKDFFEPLKRGVGNKYRTEVFLKDDPEKLLAYFKLLKDENCVILLENRMPAEIVAELKQYLP